MYHILYTCINNFTLSHEVLVPGPGAVSPAGGWHSAAVWAQRGVAHHLTHLYQQAVRAARHAGPRPRHQPRPAEGCLVVAPNLYTENLKKSKNNRNSFLN